jgi:hypothetical protein
LPSVPAGDPASGHQRLSKGARFAASALFCSRAEMP